jgi:hypothetical protein
MTAAGGAVHQSEWHSYGTFEIVYEFMSTVLTETRRVIVSNKCDIDKYVRRDTSGYITSKSQLEGKKGRKIPPAHSAYCTSAAKVPELP